MATIPKKLLLTKKDKADLSRIIEGLPQKDRLKMRKLFEIVHHIFDDIKKNHAASMKVIDQVESNFK